MRHPLRRLPGFTLLLIGLLAVAWTGARTLAQEATPRAGGMPAGVSLEVVGVAHGVEQPSPADLMVLRLGFAPGTTARFAGPNQLAGLLVVESGAFTLRMEAPLRVTRTA